ncbi:MAG: hypothetical protein WAU47_07450 [Desulfobaccales bacterium]
MIKRPGGRWNHFRVLGAVILAGILAVSCATAGGASAAGTAAAPGSAPASREVAVLVELEKPAGDAQGIDRHQIQKDVETRLRQAGINVAAQMQTPQAAGLPVMYVNVIIAKCDAMFAYNADIVYLSASSRQSPAKSGQGTLGTSGIVADISQVRPKVAELVHRFIKDYLAV